MQSVQPKGRSLAMDHGFCQTLLSRRRQLLALLSQGGTGGSVSLQLFSIVGHLIQQHDRAGAVLHLITYTHSMNRERVHGGEKRLYIVVFFLPGMSTYSIKYCAKSSIGSSYVILSRTPCGWFYNPLFLSFTSGQTEAWGREVICSEI